MGVRTGQYFGACVCNAQSWTNALEQVVPRPAATHGVVVSPQAHIAHIAREGLHVAYSGGPAASPGRRVSREPTSLVPPQLPPPDYGLPPPPAPDGPLPPIPQSSRSRVPPAMSPSNRPPLPPPSRAPDVPLPPVPIPAPSQSSAAQGSHGLPITLPNRQHYTVGGGRKGHTREPFEYDIDKILADAQRTVSVPDAVTEASVAELAAAEQNSVPPVPAESLPPLPPPGPGAPSTAGTRTPPTPGPGVMRKLSTRMPVPPVDPKLLAMSPPPRRKSSLVGATLPTIPMDPPGAAPAPVSNQPTTPRTARTRHRCLTIPASPGKGARATRSPWPLLPNSSCPGSPSYISCSRR